MDRSTVDALNALLEDERASVEAIVKLVSMVTDALERQALTAMGGQAVQACGDLHQRLEQLGLPVGARISPAVDRVLAHERLDDRLSAFSLLQQQLADRTEAILASQDMDPDTASLLAAIRAVQLAHAVWSSRRAEEFAASRLMGLEPAGAARSSVQPGAHASERLDLVPPGAHTEVAGTHVGTDQADYPEADGGNETRPTPRGRPRRTRWPGDDLEQQNGDHS
jgi:hypothetical protein